MGDAILNVMLAKDQPLHLCFVAVERLLATEEGDEDDCGICLGYLANAPNYTSNFL